MESNLTQHETDKVRRSLLQTLCVRVPLGALYLVSGLSALACSLALAGSTDDAAALQQNVNQPVDARMDVRASEINDPGSLEYGTSPRPIVVGRPVSAVSGPRPISVSGKQVKEEHTQPKEPQDGH